MAFLFTKLFTEIEKTFIFREKASFARLSTTHSESITRFILLLISSREAGCEYKLFSTFVLTRPVIEPKFTVSAADVLSTLATNDKK